MPVKRRAEKRRLDPAAELAAWEATFEFGRDFFGDLARIGVTADRRERPSEEALASAWQRLGPAFLAQRTEPRPSWAERNMGGFDAH